MRINAISAACSVIDGPATVGIDDIRPGQHPDSISIPARSLVAWLPSIGACPRQLNSSRTTFETHLSAVTRVQCATCDPDTSRIARCAPSIRWPSPHAAEAPARQWPRVRTTAGPHGPTRTQRRRGRAGRPPQPHRVARSSRPVKTPDGRVPCNRLLEACGLPYGVCGLPAHPSEVSSNIIRTVHIGQCKRLCDSARSDSSNLPGRRGSEPLHVLPRAPASARSPLPIDRRVGMMVDLNRDGPSAVETLRANDDCRHLVSTCGHAVNEHAQGRRPWSAMSTLHQIVGQRRNPAVPDSPDAPEALGSELPRDEWR